MTPTEQENITSNAAASAARRVSAQIGQTAEQAAQVATRSLYRQQMAKIRRNCLIGAVVGVAILGAFYAGSLRTGKSRTPRPQDRATAKCMDGTWSYAATRQGACAAHGGVKTFYK